MLVIGVVLGIVFLSLALRNTDYSRLAAALQRANYWYTIPLLLCLGLFYWIKAIRWRILLTPVRAVTTAEVFPAMMAGFASNNLLPAHLGEIVRVVLLGRQLQVSNSAILATVILERCLDFLALLLLVGGMLAFQSDAPPILYSAGYFLGAMGLGTLVMAIILATWTDRFIRCIQSITAFAPSGIHKHIREQLLLGAAGLRSLRNGRLLIGMVWTSMTQWILMGLCIYCSMIAMDLNIGLSASLFTLALIVVGITLPSAPGFVGTIELCFVLALRPYGVASENAFAASAFYHVLVFFAVTGVGILCIHHCGSTLRKLHQQVIDT